MNKRIVTITTTVTLSYKVFTKPAFPAAKFCILRKPSFHNSQAQNTKAALLSLQFLVFLERALRLASFFSFFLPESSHAVYSRRRKFKTDLWKLQYRCAKHMSSRRKCLKTGTA